MSISHWGMFPVQFATENVVVEMDGRGFTVTREEILDNVAEEVLLVRFRHLIAEKS